MTGDFEHIGRSESIVRLVNTKYVVEDVVSVEAFATSIGETYLSVNRPFVESFNDDVKSFVKTHNDFILRNNASLSCYGAKMKVGEVCDISVVHGSEKLDVSVEVEPRAAHTKSHAGIFVRSNNNNVVRGRQLTSLSIPHGVSTDSILMEVQWRLHDIAKLEILKLEE
ncbi:MAG: hypothetical protein II852_00225 [Bacteroidales bacterium]|nr:hypothetical protein [Bacteroidales bacterium]